MRIILDPGHGGKFTGARILGGFWEKDVTLDICLQAEVKNEALEKQYSLLQDEIARKNEELGKLQAQRKDLTRRLKDAQAKMAAVYVPDNLDGIIAEYRAMGFTSARGGS